MNGPLLDGVSSDGGDGWLLALHSSGEGFGVGVLPWPLPGEIGATPSFSGSPAMDLPPLDPLLRQARLQHFATGRDLSNRLLSCVDAVLPASEWPRLRRLAVALSRGVLARSGVLGVLGRSQDQQEMQETTTAVMTSFLLIARRLCRGAQPPVAPFWLEQELPRRGRVAGLYGRDPALPGGVVELEPPRLRQAQELLSGERRAAEPRLPDDVGELLAISALRARQGLPAAWQAVVPIYPTSPVQQT